jgi:hypothetical protein
MTETRLLKRSAERWKPHRFQGKGVVRLVDNAAQCLFASPGAGKTSITLAAFKFLRKKGIAEKMLVIAPLRPCYLVWPAEVDKWLDFEHLTYTVLHGPDKEDRLDDDVDIYIINPEGLEWLFGAETFTTKTGKKGVELDLTRFKKLGVDTLVIDELTAFKNHQSVRFSMMKQVIKLFKRRWGLTGSPAANGLLGLFGQMYMIDEGRSFGPYITQFRTTYFMQHPWMKFRWDVKTVANSGVDGEKAIFERLKPMAMRVDAADYIDMPSAVPLRIEVDLPDKARKIYDMMEEDLFALVDAGRQKDVVPATAANSGVALGKCRQIASGGLYPDAGFAVKGFKTVAGVRPYVDLHDEKVKALGERLEELQGQPYLLGYEYQHSLDRILKKFPFAKYIGSGIDMAEAKKLERQWNDGELPLLLGHPQSIGHGLNMQESSQNVGWFDLTWDYELYDQFIRRVLRQGNKCKHVFIDHYIALDTVDEVLFRVATYHGSKAKGQGRLFEFLQDRRRNKK